jgi:hypothetical protein
MRGITTHVIRLTSTIVKTKVRKIAGKRVNSGDSNALITRKSGKIASQVSSAIL